MRLVMAEISRSEDMIHYTEDMGLKGYPRCCTSNKSLNKDAELYCLDSNA